MARMSTGDWPPLAENVRFHVPKTGTNRVFVKVPG